MKKQAIFLDRDGTINEDVGYFCSMDQFHFIPKAIDALKALQKDFMLFIVTNQSGVARKFFSEKELITFNRQVEQLLLKNGIKITKTYYCPHLSQEDCVCHKPSPYFLKQAEKEYDIDLKRSFVVGDHPHDIEMGLAVGARAVYVLTGHGQKHRAELNEAPHFLTKSLYEAALWILAQIKEHDIS